MYISFSQRTTGSVPITATIKSIARCVRNEGAGRPRPVPRCPLLPTDFFGDPSDLLSSRLITLCKTLPPTRGMPSTPAQDAPANNGLATLAITATRPTHSVCARLHLLGQGPVANHSDDIVGVG